MQTQVSARPLIWSTPFPKQSETQIEKTLNLYDDANLSITLDDTLDTLEELTSEGKNLLDPVKLYVKNLIKRYPAKYEGQVTEETSFGCNLVARKLGDRYDPESKRCTNLEHVNQDYFGIIAQENLENRCLIAMDKNFVLSFIQEYYQIDQQIKSQRPEILREYMATLNPIINVDGSYTTWENKPNFRKIAPINLEDLSIYYLNDPEVGYISETNNWNEYDSSVVMVFAKVPVDVANTVNSYIYRQINFFSAKGYLTVPNLPLDAAKDFEYLFPVKLHFIKNLVNFSSELMTSAELTSAFYKFEVSRSFPRLDPIQGCYASYLLAESLGYRFPVSWENSVLVIKNAGYLQAQDIFKRFAEILADIRAEGVRFQRVPNYLTAVSISEDSDLKSFKYQGNYYIATPYNIDWLNPTVSDDPANDMIDWLNPLVQMESHPEETKNYLTKFGYEVNLSQDYNLEIDLGHRTYEISELNNEVLTVYYYRSTHEMEIDVYQEPKPFSLDTFNRVQDALREGYFFSQKMKNITSGYPGFIPGYPTLSLPLKTQN